MQLIEDLNDKTPSVFTIAKRFFHQYKRDCELSSLSEDDFESLIRLCLSSDRILIGDKACKQKSGLAMGNNLAPILAIIYMNEIDRIIIERTNNNVTLKRYIDDYIALLLSQDMSAHKLLSIANDVNDAIKFTLDVPNDNQLPFLDTLVSYNSDVKSFSTTLYLKPIHSMSIIPWDSHGSIMSKRAILIGEIKRAIKCSTDLTARKQSLKMVSTLFINNGYPKRFVKATIKQTVNNTTCNQDNEKVLYLKIPFVNEDLKRRALSVIRRSGIDNVRLTFVNGKALSRVFAPSKERLQGVPKNPKNY